MGSDVLYSKSSKSSDKASKPSKGVKSKSSLLFLALTVLVLQAADYAVVWWAGGGSAKGSYWSQVDIFVGIFVLFYIGKRLSSKFKTPSPTPASPEETSEEEEEAEQTTTSRTSSPAKDTRFRSARRVVSSSRSDKMDKVEKSKLRTEPSNKSDWSSFKSSGLRAEAPPFVAAAAQPFVSQPIEGLRAEAPEFVPGLGPKEMSKEPKVVPPPAKVSKVVPPQDCDEVGEVLFRSAHAAEMDEVARMKLKRAAKKKADSQQSKPKPAITEKITQKATTTEKITQKATTELTWQPKERTIWKSSHVVEAL